MCYFWHTVHISSVLLPSSDRFTPWYTRRGPIVYGHSEKEGETCCWLHQNFRKSRKNQREPVRAKKAICNNHNLLKLLFGGRAALIAQLIKAQLRRPQPFWPGFKSRQAELVFSKMPFSPLLSYWGDCDVLNAQTCNDPRQRWGNNLGRGGGSPPASQLAELFWVSCHLGKLRRTKVPVQKQQTNKISKLWFGKPLGSLHIVGQKIINYKCSLGAWNFFKYVWSLWIAINVLQVVLTEFRHPMCDFKFGKFWLSLFILANGLPNSS